MKKSEPTKSDALDWENKATQALERARLMPAGQEKNEALKKAGMLRNAADIRELFFAKRCGPPK